MFGNKLKQLQKRSTKDLNIFQRTIDSLNKTNQEIFNEREKKVQKIKDLQAEAMAMLSLATANNKVVEKIQTFLDE